MTNDEIKKYARIKGVRQYELADAFGMNESVMSRMFRYELDAEMQDAIMKMIDKLADKKETTGKLPATVLMRERILETAKLSSIPKEVPQKKTSVKKEVPVKEESPKEKIVNSMFEEMGIEDIQ